MSDTAVERARKKRVSGETTREVWCGHGHRWTETWVVPDWAKVAVDPWNRGVWVPDDPKHGQVTFKDEESLVGDVFLCRQCVDKMRIQWQHYREMS